MPPPRQDSLVLVYTYAVIMLSANFVTHVCSWRQEWSPNYVVSHEELNHGELQKFKGEKHDTDHFKVLLSEADHILIGAKNKVHNISLLTLEEDVERMLNWEPNKLDVQLCQKKLAPNLQSKCENYIQVLGKMNDTLYVCGTNAFKPKCRVYEYKEADYPKQAPGYTSIREDSGVGKCPYDPEHNSTSIYADGKLYSATVSDFLAKDPLIMESGRMVRTEQHDSNMLSDPNFVSSFEIDDKIYFFLRENAVENINCGKASFSRVARVCKNDGGGQFKDVWTSYFKARLNCSVPGDSPFSFDELQSTSDFQLGNYMSTRDASNRTRMFYGVFNTPENSIWGSAICAFKYEDIENAFKGRFKGQESASHNWLSIAQDKTPDPHPQRCEDDSKRLMPKTLDFIRDHPLMDSAVMPMGGSPVVIQTDTRSRFTAVAIDWQVLASHTYYDVIFIGTSDGRVLKAINAGLHGHTATTVIEDLQVLGRHEAIRQLKIYRHAADPAAEKLIVFSQDNIVALPLQRCHKQTTCGNCLQLQDPYCSWHSNECTSHSSRGLQDIHGGSDQKCPEGSKRGNPTMRPTTMEVPLKAPCPTCNCDCKNQSEPSITVVMGTNYSDGGATHQSPNLDQQEDRTLNDDSNSQPVKEPCVPRSGSGRTDREVFTASTLAISCVVCIVVAILGGFVIGYRISLCRNNTRNTDQMINYEQNFGSLRKHPNRQASLEAHNIYNEPTKQQYKIQNNQKNILVSNIIPVKSPNLPNGSIESTTVTPKQASKTYL